MNYRHAFHAGNFADVLKHAIFARILAYLGEKPAAFRVIDTHAGAGLYDLSADAATRTGEWRQGVGRLWLTRLSAHAETVLSPWRQAVAAANPDGTLRAYPGSPLVAATLARPQDRFNFVEPHVEDGAALRRLFRADPRAKVSDLDGWLALPAFVPPPERRGVAIVDPPFEEPGEFARMAEGLAKAHARWPTGCFLLWYPLKDVAAAERFGDGLAASGIADMLRVELRVGPVRADGPLAACGLILVNAPWTMEADLSALLPDLAAALATDGHGRHRLDRLTDEHGGRAPRRA